MEFGMKIASNCILKEINNGCQNNLVISPFLLHVALNMLASASTGRTLQQLLHFLDKESIADLDEQSSLFMELESSAGVEGPIVSVFNVIWLDHRFPVKHSFKQLAKNVYRVRPDSVDFVNQGEQVRDEVNTWARQASKGHIDPLLPHDFFKEYAIALLASAIYFKGEWFQTFDALNTQDEDFHLINGQTIKVPFMKRHSNYGGYGSFESFKLLKMYYKYEGLYSKQYAMYIFLPHQNDGLQELVEKFHADPRFLLENREVEKRELEKVWLPKLKYEYVMNAEESMKEVGLDLPFDKKKSEITEMVETSEIVYLSKAIQKSYIEVNEQGTIAVSVFRRFTGTAAPSPEPPPSFVADHPFLFMIKEEFSGIILFLGAVFNPIT